MITATIDGKKLSASLDLAAARYLLQTKGINMLRPDIAQGASPQPLGVAITLDPLMAGEIAHGLFVSAEQTKLAPGAFFNAAGLSQLEEIGMQIAEEPQRFFEASSRPEMQQLMTKCVSVRKVAKEMIQNDSTMDGDSSPSSQPSPTSTPGDSPSENLPEPQGLEDETTGSDQPS